MLVLIMLTNTLYFFSKIMLTKLKNCDTLSLDILCAKLKFRRGRKMSNNQTSLLSVLFVGIMFSLVLFFSPSAFAGDKLLSKADAEKVMASKSLSSANKVCLTCHKDMTQGAVYDWANSAHAQKGVGCYDCHGVESNSPLKVNHASIKDGGKELFITSVVSAKQCGKCHKDEVEQMSKSGHARGFLQYEKKEDMQKLMNYHEGRDNANLKGTPEQTGCSQCHGNKITITNGKVDQTTWNTGIGNVYPDGSIGSCTPCHTRHAFSKAEARKPEACGSCHLGPDHPDMEIYANSKHGQLFAAEGDKWNFNYPKDKAVVGVDFRGPTCATCHMSGINGVATTHDVSVRLKWNLWAPRSMERGNESFMSPARGDAAKGRADMKTVCAACHSSLVVDAFFKRGDNQVELYNTEYFDVAKKMLDDLKSKNLLAANPWQDKFQVTYYYLWHHEGRRARQGALMGGPDYAHWHGNFEIMQDLYKMKAIYEKRVKDGKVEDFN